MRRFYTTDTPIRIRRLYLFKNTVRRNNRAIDRFASIRCSGACGLPAREDAPKRSFEDWLRCPFRRRRVDAAWAYTPRAPRMPPAPSCVDGSFVFDPGRGSPDMADRTDPITSLPEASLDCLLASANPSLTGWVLRGEQRPFSVCIRVVEKACGRGAAGLFCTRGRVVPICGATLRLEAGSCGGFEPNPVDREGGHRR